MILFKQSPKSYTLLYLKLLEAAKLVGEHFTRFLQHANLLASLFLRADARPDGLRLAVVHHVGVMNRELTLNNLSRLAFAARLDVLRLHVNILAEHLPGLGEDFHHVRHLAFIRPRDDDDLIVRLHVHRDAHRKSTRRERLLFPLLLRHDFHAASARRGHRARDLRRSRRARPSVVARGR